VEKVRREEEERQTEREREADSRDLFRDCGGGCETEKVEDGVCVVEALALSICPPTQHRPSVPSSQT